MHRTEIDYGISQLITTKITLYRLINIMHAWGSNINCTILVATLRSQFHANSQCMMVGVTQLDKKKIKKTEHYCFNKRYWNFLTKSGITLIPSHQCFSVKPVKIFSHQLQVSSHHHCYQFVIEMRIDAKLVQDDTSAAVYNSEGILGTVSHAMTRRRACNNLGTNFNFLVTWE